MEPTSASPGNPLETQVIRHDLPLTEPEMPRLGPSSLCLHKPSGDSEAAPVREQPAADVSQAREAGACI